MCVWSRARGLCRVPGSVTEWLQLDLVGALSEYDKLTALCSRTLVRPRAAAVTAPSDCARQVPPTFVEVRHIQNMATVHAVAPHLKLVRRRRPGGATMVLTVSYGCCSAAQVCFDADDTARAPSPPAPPLRPVLTARACARRFTPTGATLLPAAQ